MTSPIYLHKPLDFIKRGFEAAQDWMSNLMSEYDLSTEKIIGNLGMVQKHMF
jgi:hypothetical protein